ncbi:MAG: nucleotidyl transferase AbiEii/AbiGii toxin family protein, partial [Chloroflexota bacterium]
GAIHRFSEDVDITLDYRALAPDADPFEPNLSKTKLKKLAENLKENVKQHTFNIVVPHFQKILDQYVHNSGMSVQCNDLGERVWIKYDSVIPDRAEYMADSVLIEFGGRNATEPSEGHLLVPFAAPFIKELIWPEATVDVLSPKRTFWEKATLIHAECSQGEMKAEPERLSRHWYDLAMLEGHPIGVGALADRALLRSVVEHKNIFFYSARAKYRDCLVGKMRLVPAEPMATELRKDFKAMLDAGMFDQEPPTFDTILKRLDGLVQRINEVAE